MLWIVNLAHPYLLYPDASLSVGFVVTSVLYVILCFVLLGITASEYLCPNVAKIADFNDHGTGTLMAVLLAWCNSSPDLFSNFMSWTSTITSNGAALSIGEVLGACGIILCIVEGSIFMIMSSTALDISYSQKVNVLRDLAFTLVAMLFMWYVCLFNRVTAIDCVLMIAVYISYLAVKFIWRPGGTQEDEEYNQNEAFPRESLEGATLSHRIKPSLISAMDFNNLLSMLENSRGDDLQTFQEELVTMNDEPFTFQQQIRPFTEPAKKSNFSETHPVPQTSPAAFAPYHDNPDEPSFEPEVLLMQPSRTIHSGKIKKIKRGLVQLFVPHLLNFRQKSTIDAILSVATVPFVIFLRLSCPQSTNILEFDETLGKYTVSNTDVMLLFTQALICPLIPFAILSCLLVQNIAWIFWMLAVFLSATLLCLSLAFYRTLLSYNRFSLLEPSLDTESYELTDERRALEKIGNILIIIYLLIGIVNAILCISLIANSLIEMLEIYQKITKASQAILGLTVFALGNSISDLISNIAMCKLYRKMPSNEQDVRKMATKFFMISCTSCIGGVLLNSMGGIGLSGLISMIFVHKSSSNWAILRSVKLHDSDDSHDYKFTISCIAIIVQILLLAIFFGSPQVIHNWCKSRMKGIGLAMCIIWGIATIFNVSSEVFF